MSTQCVKLKVYKWKRWKNKDYVDRIVKLPRDFPQVETVVVLTENEYSKIVSKLSTQRKPEIEYSKEQLSTQLPEWVKDVGRVGSYYIVCTECRKHIAHLVVETEDSITYYCPFCNKAIVLRKKLSTQR